MAVLPPDCYFNHHFIMLVITLLIVATCPWKQIHLGSWTLNNSKYFTLVFNLLKCRQSDTRAIHIVDWECLTYVLCMWWQNETFEKDSTSVCCVLSNKKLWPDSAMKLITNIIYFWFHDDYLPILPQKKLL